MIERVCFKTTATQDKRRGKSRGEEDRRANELSAGGDAQSEERCGKEFKCDFVGLLV